MSDTTGQKAAGQDEAAADKDGKAEEPVDNVVTTRHAITADGAELRYTVTAGRVVLRQEGHTDEVFDGAQAKAEVFMVAYTLDDADAASRPVTFAFNGGPGSASVCCCRRRMTWPTITKPCSGIPTLSSSTRYPPGSRARSRAGSPRNSTGTAATSSRSAS